MATDDLNCTELSNPTNGLIQIIADNFISMKGDTWTRKALWSHCAIVQKTSRMPASFQTDSSPSLDVLKKRPDQSMHNNNGNFEFLKHTCTDGWRICSQDKGMSAKELYQKSVPARHRKPSTIYTFMIVAQRLAIILWQKFTVFTLEQQQLLVQNPFLKLSVVNSIRMLNKSSNLHMKKQLWL